MEALAAALIAGIVAIGVALFQMNRQHRSSLVLQEAHLRHQLQLEIFREVSDQLRRMALAFSTANSRVSHSVKEFEDQLQRGTEVTETGEELISIHHTASRSVAELQILIERYEIVFLRLSSARRILSNETMRFHQGFSEFMKAAGLFLPHKNGPRPHPFKPTPADVAQIRHAADEYANVCGNYLGFVLDLQVESQNMLLGDLFKRTVPPRNPLDPTVPVLKADTEAELLARVPGRFI
jgi:hypothetical protein